MRALRQWVALACAITSAAVTQGAERVDKHRINLDSLFSDSQAASAQTLALPCQDCFVKFEATALTHPENGYATLLAYPLQGEKSLGDYINFSQDPNSRSWTLTTLAWIPPDADRLQLKLFKSGVAGWRWRATQLTVLPERQAKGDGPWDKRLRAQLDVIEQKALNEPTMGWKEWRRLVLRIASPADERAYLDIVQFALMQLPDNHHSRIVPRRLLTAKQLDMAMPQSDRLGAYAVLKLSDMSTRDPAIFQRYIDALGEQLKTAADTGAKGVIIDLRNHGGGSVHALMTGLSPLFPDPSPIGWTMDRNGASGALSLVDGHYVEFAQNTVEDSAETAEMRAIARIRLAPQWRTAALQRLPVALLVGWGTKSASEISAFLLHQRPNTRIFGQATGRLLSGVEGFPLTKRFDMGLVTGGFMDAQGHRAAASMQPDEVTNTPLEAAQAWLDKQAAQQVSSR